MTIESRIATAKQDAETLAVVVECELAREIIYTTRAKTLNSAIASMFRAMNQLECDATPTDFDDDWRSLRLRLALAQSRFEAVINGSGDLACSLPPCRPKSSRYWT